jgi:hypothetical protein
VKVERRFVGVDLIGGDECSTGPVWVLSTGRVGSTLMANLLSAAASEGGVHHQVRGARGVNILGNFVASRRLPRVPANLVARLLFGLNFSESTADPLRSMLLAANLRDRVLPFGLRIVHIVRDPRDFVSSFMNWKTETIKRRILHHVVPAWQPNPWLAGEVALVRWMRMKKFEHFAWIWNHKNQLFGEFADQLEYRRFRLEDLIASNGDRRALDELEQFVGISLPPQLTRRAPDRVNASAGLFPKWPSWSATQARILDEHCGELMLEYGYGYEPEWHALLGKSGDTG